MSKAHFIGQKIMSQGTPSERRVIKEETEKEARTLADKVPTFLPDRTMFIRQQVQKALRGELEVEVFRRFAILTNSWEEIETVLPRAKLIERK